MLQRCLAFLCLLPVAFGIIPRPLADIPIPTPDSKKINLRQYRGKVLLVTLISTSCGDCIKTIDILNGIQKDFGKRGFQVVGIAIEDSAAYNVGGFVARYRPSFPVGYLDRDTAIKFLDVSRDTRPFVPILMYVDGKGTVRFQYYGNDAFLKQGERAIRAVAEGLIREGEQQRAQQRAAAAAAAAKSESPKPEAPKPEP
jgi:thiol-disulfide isomerase/thioredoxin